MKYTQNDILKNSDGKRYYKSKIYPQIPLSEDDVYIMTTIGDRLDTLAYNFYKDTKYWKIITIVNNNITKGSIYPIPGTQLRLPSDINAVIALYDELNK